MRSTMTIHGPQRATLNNSDDLCAHQSRLILLAATSPTSEGAGRANSQKNRNEKQSLKHRCLPRREQLCNFSSSSGGERIQKWFRNKQAH